MPHAPHALPRPEVPVLRSRPSDTPRGMGLAALAYFIFALQDSTVKWLVGGGIPAWEVLCVRSLVIVLACLAVGRRRLIERSLATPIKRWLLLRGVLTMVAWLAYYTASGRLSLAKLLTLYFSAPLLTTLLAIPILRERIPLSRWIALAVGFAGVLVACDPGGVTFSWATALVLVAAVLWGYTVVLMRQTALAESNLLLMFYSNGLFLVVTSVACATVSWQPPTAGQAVALIAVGMIGGVAQFVLFESFRHAAASLLAPVEYSALIWGFVLGYLVFGDIPGVGVFAGAALILASGAILLASARRPAQVRGSR